MNIAIYILAGFGLAFLLLGIAAFVWILTTEDIEAIFK